MGITFFAAAAHRKIKIAAHNIFTFKVRPDGFLLCRLRRLCCVVCYKLIVLLNLVLILLLVTALLPFIQLLLNIWELFRIRLLFISVCNQAGHGFVVRLNDGVGLFFGQSHTFQHFACNTHLIYFSFTFLRCQFFDTGDKNGLRRL